METKKCFKCGVVKSIDSFYTHTQMADGHLNKCISCTKKDVKDRAEVLKDDPSWLSKERERGREKYYRLGYKEKHKPTPDMKKKCMTNYSRRYPEKMMASSLSGSIKAPRGKEKHHWSYKQEHGKDVLFLTPKEHYCAHRYMVYDQEMMMYRRVDTMVLLDSKDAHKRYILKCIENERNLFHKLSQDIQ